MDDSKSETSEKPVIPTPPTPVKKPNQPKNKKPLIIVIIALMALIVIGLIVMVALLLNQKPATDSSILTPAQDGNSQVSELERDISSVVTKVSPSVVSIITTGEIESFYGSRSVDGAGTGMIFSKDGYVLTNKHVIDNATNMAIVTSDGTRYDKVELIGSDPLNDVAILKIAGVNDLTPIEIGDSRTTRVGQTVVAIGNSLGQYQTTVTSGIISGKGRPVSAASGSGQMETLTDLLQTDAAINPGNSGGPLVNISGQVVGINTAIASDAEGIGFSIPINAVKGILKSVLDDGEFERPFIGIGFIMVTPDVAKRFDLGVSSGAYVYQNGRTNPVVSGSPAEEAGIEAEDIITKINDIELGYDASLSTAVSEFAPGETVKVTYLRDGKQNTVDVVLDSYQEN